jgi:hypothetical protein
LIKDTKLDDHQQAFLDSKRREFEQAAAASQAQDDSGGDAFPEGSQLCTKCQTKAMIRMDNCLTCLNCGESKCG